MVKCTSYEAPPCAVISSLLPLLLSTLSPRSQTQRAATIQDNRKHQSKLIIFMIMLSLM